VHRVSKGSEVGLGGVLSDIHGYCEVLQEVLGFSSAQTLLTMRVASASLSEVKPIMANRKLSWVGARWVMRNVILAEAQTDCQRRVSRCAIVRL